MTTTPRAHRVQAIPTTYRGVQMRSRLEADWARQFDRWGVPWLYETEGVNLDGLWYLPDFWLPACQTFFEVKGLWESLDEEKLSKLYDAAISSQLVVAVGERGDDGDLLCGIVTPTPDDIRFMGETWPPLPVITYETASVVRCKECGGVWIMDQCGLWRCRVCGAYDGGNHIDTYLNHSWTYVASKPDHPLPDYGNRSIAWWYQEIGYFDEVKPMTGEIVTY